MSQLFLIVFHHFGFGAIFSRVIEDKLTSEKAGFHFAQIAYMLFRNMHLTCRENVA